MRHAKASVKGKIPVTKHRVTQKTVRAQEERGWERDGNRTVKKSPIAKSEGKKARRRQK